MQCFVVLFLKQKLSVMFKKKMKQTSVTGFAQASPVSLSGLMGILNRHSACVI